MLEHRGGGANRRGFLATGVRCTVAASTFWSASVAAQGSSDYPARAVRIIVPFPPGGATDLMTRNVSRKLNESWKQPVLVENRGGANGMIGADAVAKAAGDGYTMLTATIAHAANVSLYPKSPYQFLGDLRPLAVLGLIPLVAVVRADSSIASFADLVERGRTGRLNGGSGGNGTAAHLALELFNVAARVRALHVPYKGGAPAMTDLLGGQIDVIFALLPEALPHLRSGRLRGLAITGDQRHPLVSGIATTTEVGYPALVITSWSALMGPAALPRELVARVNTDVRRALDDPEIRAALIDQGFQPVGWGVAESESFVNAEVAKWAKLITEANIKPD
jgi:tripartite-type tricarboxylate transporter receptor subunit TctC